VSWDNNKTHLQKRWLDGGRQSQRHLYCQPPAPVPQPQPTLAQCKPSLPFGVSSEPAERATTVGKTPAQQAL